MSCAPDLNPADQIITSNHGGRKAKWGYENLDANVLVYKPDLVTLWWGMNDLNGCPGIFDRTSNKLLQYELTAMINDHMHYMQLQIDALLNTEYPGHRHHTHADPRDASLESFRHE